MKTAELTGRLLDYWVARTLALGHIQWYNGRCWAGEEHASAGYFEPSVKWHQGGPIIERDGIATWRGHGCWYATPPRETGYTGDSGYIDVNDWDSIAGPTALIAAMRAKVHSIYGDEVPDEAKP